MNLKPLEDRIIIKPLDTEEKTSGGIIIPDNAKEKPHRGEVAPLCPGKFSDMGNKITMTLKKVIQCSTVNTPVLKIKFKGSNILV
jgi:chaperonin GroES